MVLSPKQNSIAPPRIHILAPWKSLSPPLHLRHVLFTRISCAHNLVCGVLQHFPQQTFLSDQQVLLFELVTQQHLSPDEVWNDVKILNFYAAVAHTTSPLTNNYLIGPHATISFWRNQIQCSKPTSLPPGLTLIYYYRDFWHDVSQNWTPLFLSSCKRNPPQLQRFYRHTTFSSATKLEYINQPSVRPVINNGFQGLVDFDV